MPAIARVSDMFIGICCCHTKPRCRNVTGVIITGSGDILTNGMETARLRDIGLGFCGHTCFISTGGSALLNGIPVARIGDRVRTFNPRMISTTNSRVQEITLPAQTCAI